MSRQAFQKALAERVKQPEQPDIFQTRHLNHHISTA